jgi:hypothetical protein
MEGTDGVMQKAAKSDEPVVGTKRAAPINAEAPKTAFVALAAGAKKSSGGTKAKKALEMEQKLHDGNAAIEAILQARGARPVSDFQMSVISKGRSDNVPLMMRLFEGTGAELTWVVGVGESKAYTAKGAHACVEGGGLCKSRNMAIELARTAGKLCVEMSDDLNVVSILLQEGEYAKPKDLSEGTALAKASLTYLVSPVHAARFLECEMRATGAKLAGAHPTGNPGQMMMNEPTSDDLFIVGDFLVIDPDSEPRFDEKMTLKEDYDLTAQHLFKYGKVLRSNRVCVMATHYTNGGGAVELRGHFNKDEPNPREQYNIGVLRYKWPGVCPQHGTRGVNEVRFAWTMRGSVIGGTKNVKRPPAPDGYFDSGSGSSSEAGSGGGRSSSSAPPAVKKNTILNFFALKK